MAMNSSVTCDWTVTVKVKRKAERTKCGKPAPQRVALPVGRLIFAGDLCDSHQKHLQRLLAETGLEPATNVDSKQRAAYVAKSGTPFSGEDARPWLIEQGLAGERGRIARHAIEAYAAAH